jgi:hypothetical protein
MRVEPRIAIESRGEETPQPAIASAVAKSAGGLKFIPIPYTCGHHEGSPQYPDF